MFKDGELGIFDTKASDYNEDDNVEKSNALQKYITKENAKGKNLIGGLVIQESGHFRINRKAEYKPYKASSGDWEYFAEVVNLG
jgi:type III restriction enzyme